MRRSRRWRSSPAPVQLAPADQPVFEALRELRAALAREQAVPAYVIFHDATLRTIAERRPASLAELGTVGGVGAAKLERYGPRVLELLTDL